MDAKLAVSFDDLAGTVTLVRSASPDLSQAALFVPISQTITGSTLYGNRVMAGAVIASWIVSGEAPVAAQVRRRVCSPERPLRRGSSLRERLALSSACFTSAGYSS